MSFCSPVGVVGLRSLDVCSLLFISCGVIGVWAICRGGMGLGVGGVVGGGGGGWVGWLGVMGVVSYDDVVFLFLL